MPMQNFVALRQTANILPIRNYCIRVYVILEILIDISTSWGLVGRLTSRDDIRMDLEIKSTPTYSLPRRPI